MNEERAISLKRSGVGSRLDVGLASGWPVLLVLLIGTALSIFLFRTARSWEMEHVRDEFEKDVAVQGAAFRETVDLLIHELESLHAFYAASKEVTRADFRLFATNLLKSNPTIQALEWIPRIPAQARTAYSEAARADGYPLFEIRERDPQGNLVKAGPRDTYFPVYFVEPYLGNEAALGYDLASDPTRRQALVEARKKGKPHATTRIRLVQDQGNQYGCLAFYPVYGAGVPLHSPTHRLEHLKGFVLAVLRINDMLARTLKPLGQTDIETYLFDRAAPEGEQFLGSYPFNGVVDNGLEGLTEPALRKGIYRAESMDFLDRQWLLIGTPTPDFLASRKTPQPRAFLLGALLLTGMLSATFWLGIKRQVETRDWAYRLMQSKKELEEEAASRQRVQEALDRRVRHAEMQVQIGKALTKGDHLDPMLQNCAHALVTHLDIDLIQIWTLEEGQAFLQLRATAGLSSDADAPAESIPVGSDFIGSIAATQAPRFTNELFHDGAGTDWEWVPQQDLVAFAGYPLIVENRIAGVLAAFSRRPIDAIAKKALAFVADEIAIGVTRKETEELLRRERDRIQTYLEVAGVMLLALTSDGRVALINRQGCQILGYQEEDIVGQEWFENFLPATGREEVRRVFRKLMAGELDAVEYFENPVITESGEEKLIAWHNTLLRDKSGKIVGTLSSGENITERRKMEEEHLKMQKLDSLGVLAGGLAHDFNNLLTGILSNVGLAKLTAGSREQTVERLEEAERASLRARDLILQLLTFSKGGAPIRKSMSISQLVQESVGFALRGSNVACEYRLDEELWPVSVDESQISQVIHNLILNADQAMPAGGTITVSLSNATVSADEVPGLEPGNYVLLSVADRGLGIPQEQLPRIFDPYFTTKSEGSGLGLATVYSIVQRHNGHIAVESEVNDGSTFRLYLPAAPRAVVPRETMAESCITGGGRVLVMDDDELIRNAAGEMLRRLGYEVDFAKDGEEALEKYQQARADKRPLDILIMDLTIPGGMGGKEAIEKLREIDPDVRAIVSSGYSSDPVMAEAEKYGFHGVVAKPYTIAELSRVLHDVMRKTGLLGA